MRYYEDRSQVEIARELGLPESTVRYYRDAFAGYLPAVGTGRRRRYPLEAIPLLRVVADGYAQNRARDQDYVELSHEARGLTLLYGRQAGLKLLSAKRLELATGDRIFYRGLDPFPGQGPAFRTLPKGVVDLRRVRARKSVRFEFTPPGAKQTLLAVGRPLKVGRQTFGVLAVGKAGAVNAAILAAQVLGRSPPRFDEAVRKQREAKSAEILADPDPTGA